MAAKNDVKETPPAAPAPAETAAETAAPAPAFGLKAWLPAIVVVLLAPAASWAVADFVLLPRLQRQLALPAAEAPAAAPAPAHGKSAHGKGDEAAAAFENFEFTDIVVNLSGTMGTRYLKCSFVVTGAEPGIKAAFDGHKAQLTDVTLNVLSSLTLADLEEPGAKNVLRERLVSTYNQALGRRVADQVYFSDFVVQ